MHRKRLNDLVRKNDVLYFAGAPYTGQAYAITGQGIVGHIYDVEVGIIAGNSIDMLPLPDRKDSLRVDGDILDYSGYEDALYMNKGFSGVAYSFEQAELVDESSFIDGLSRRDSREWYISGRPQAIASVNGSTRWYEDGSIAEKSINKDKLRVYSINTDGPNKLRWLTLTDQYDSDPCVLETFGLSQRLALDGNRINDQVLTILEQKKDFDNITTLDISDSSITNQKIANINLENIKALHLSDNKYINLETLYGLKKKYPHCEIRVDDKYL